MMMKKKILPLVLLLLLPLSVAAQQRRITGLLADSETGEPAVGVTLQLLTPDSAFVKGAISSEQGVFALTAPRDGDYRLRISSIGYQTQVKRVRIVGGKDLVLGKIQMKTDAVMLKEAQVVGQAMKVTVKEDTFIYNSAAFRTPEGSTIEELVRRLPGVTVSDDGTITHNGKTVKKILVDGKEFMTGDTKIAMKNLPTSIVEKVKAYDEKSDQARITGIDDGEEQTVLDFGLKRGMNRGLLTNVDLSLGTHSRYSEKAMAGVFSGRQRLMVFGSANNVNDMGFGGRGGRRGRNGLNATKMAALNYNYEQKDKLRLDLSAFWNHNDMDAFSLTSAENFVSQRGAFSNSRNQSYSRGNSVNAQGRLEWDIDRRTHLNFRPTFYWSQNDARATGLSASFNADPYQYVGDPLEADDQELLGRDSLMVNSQQQRSVSYSASRSYSASLNINRRLSESGRNVAIGASAGYGNTSAESLSANATRLWLMQTAAGMDSTYQTQRYSLTPADNMNYRLTASYSEPLFKGGYLQLQYNFQYKHSKSDRSTYDFSPFHDPSYDGLTPEYRGWGPWLDPLPGQLGDYLDRDLSRYSEYNNYIHQINLALRVNKDKYQLHAGIMVEPQSSKYIQDYQGLHVDTTRSVVNFAPMLNFRYRWSKQHMLRVQYRGTSSQPSISQLLDITDDSDPLNISKGNPGLKPAFTHRFNTYYNNYIQDHGRVISARLSFSATRNSISNQVTYDDVTGGRTTRPENINGDWQASASAMFNTNIDSLGRWYVNTESSGSLNNSVSYLTLDRTSGVQKNRTRTLSLGERLTMGYRNEWLELEMNGTLDYVHGRNRLQSQSNLDTWQFAYGPSLMLTAPWGTSLNTSIMQNSRRGYSDSSMNTNEVLWNAQLSQSFLKGKPLVVSIEMYDLLHQQSNFSRTINALRRSDTQYNSINSYVMLHVSYRFNAFPGGKGGGAGMGGPRDGRGSRGGFGGPGGRMGGDGRRMF